MIEWLLIGSGSTLAILLAVLVLRLAAVRRLALVSSADEVLIVRTPDGAVVTVSRLQPRAAPLDPPVVLCHGLGATRFNLDFGHLSLARFLAERGHDVFLLELRGGPLARVLTGARAGRRYDFDDHLRSDIPAALDRIGELTGAERFLWVGHSMGGMLAYAMLGSSAGERLAGVVAIGSPATWTHHRPRLERIVRSALPMLPFGICGKALAEVGAPFSGWVALPGWDSFAQARNMTGRSIRRALFNVSGDISRGHLQQFGDWVLERRFCSRDGTVDYRAGLERAEAPCLLIAGSLDRLAPPGAVREVHDRLGSTDKTLILLGRQAGQLEEYGHADLLLGRNVVREVFPAIAAWLADRSRPRAHSRPL